MDLKWICCRVYTASRKSLLYFRILFVGFFQTTCWYLNKWGRECTRAPKRREAISPLSRNFSHARNLLRVSHISLDGFPYLPPHRLGFLRRFGMKTGIHFTHFGLESGMVFEGTTGVYERIYRFHSK